MWHSKLLGLLILGLILSSCEATGEKSTAVTENNAIPTSTAIEVTAVPSLPTEKPATPAQSSEAESMSTTTKANTFAEARPFPGVILLHMLGDNRKSWQSAGFEQALVEAGYAVLNLDMRGHGDTGGETDWKLAEEDLNTAWQYFVDLDIVSAEGTAVIGASIGANMALITAVNFPDIQTAILLSPGLDYRGVTTDDRIESYGERPLLIVASKGDTYAAQSAQTLHDMALGEAELIIYDDSAHGTRLFSAQSDLSQTLIDWLQENQ